MSSPNPLLSEGWAIRRNNTCLLTLEVDCGATRAPFRACCPSGYACPSQWNVACCEVGKNCTESIATVDKPPCSNATWDLFDNNGYFCCEPGAKAWNRGGSNICARSGWVGEKGDVELRRVREGVDPATYTPTPSSTSLLASLTPISLTFSPTSTSTSTSSPSSAPSHQDPTTRNIGAIAGGTLGGALLIAIIAGIFLFLRRRKRQNTAPMNADGSNPYLLHDQNQNYGQGYNGENVKYMYQADGSVVAVHEADGGAGYGAQARELSGGYGGQYELNGQGRMAKELPVNQTLVELPAGEARR